MDSKNTFASLRKGGRTIRMNTNRREDMSLKQELDDVNTKTIADMKVLKELKKFQEPTEDEIYNSEMQSHFIPEPPKKERKSQPVFHDLKMKDFKSDQYCLLPDVPAYSPVDNGPQVILQSRSRKYPYKKKKMITTEEMKKPHISSVGVVPVRDSLDIPNLRVVLEGDPAPAEATEFHTRPKLNNTPATSFFIPKLPLQETLTAGEDRSNALKDSHEMDEEQGDTERKMPAIISSVGTASTIKFCPRTKPPIKTSFLQRRKSAKIHKKDTERAESAHSFQSSLVSGQIEFPDGQDEEYDSDIDTAVGAAAKLQGREQSREGSVKSVQELIEEARRISSSEGEPIYKQNADSYTGKRTQLEGKQKGDRKSAKSTRSAKSASSVKEGKTKDRKKSAVKVEEKVEHKRGERTVDEIIASLKDQSVYNVETEADRKIKEIMNRVISRSTAVLASDLEDEESEAAKETDDSTLATSDLPFELDLNQSSTVSPEPTSQVQDSPRIDGDNTAQGTDTFRESMKDGNLVTELITEEEEALSLTTRTTETYAAMAEIAENEYQEDAEQDEEFDDFEEMSIVMDIQQCWEDLLAPPDATAEDIISVQGEIKDIHERVGEPKPSNKSAMPPSSLSLLSSWAPADVHGDVSTKKPSKPQQPSNIHHFCTMTSEFQLPDKLMHAGRKYHTPDKYPSIKEDQPYRFKPEEPTLYERDLSSVNSDTRYDEAAERIISDANRHVFGTGSLTDTLQQHMNIADMALTGEPVTMANSESQVYWNPAPPKLGASSGIVRDLLFAQYQIEEFDEFGQVKAPTRGDEESDSSEEEKEEELSKEDKEAMERTTFKRHRSAENLAMYNQNEQEEEEQPEVQPDLVDESTDPAEPDGVDDVETGTIVVTDESAMEGETKEEPEDEADMSAKSKGQIQIRRPRTAPNQIGDNDDTLIIPQDFNTAMYEISEQKRLLEKAKKQIRVQEAFDELEKMEEPETVVTVPVTDVFDDFIVPQPTKKAKDELTPAEKALLAGRNYVILPKNRKKKKKGFKPVDMARIEAVEKFLRDKPAAKLERHESLPKLNRMIERELRVPWHIRTHRASLPDLFNFQDYQKKKRMRKDEDVREWVRGVWNKWFDEVFPPTPEGSEGEEDDVEQQGKDHSENQEEAKKEKKSKKDVISDIMSQDVEAIDPIMDTPENAEIYQILTEELDKLCEQINLKHNPTAFDFCRRGALYRKIGLLKKAEEDLDRAISMESDLLDAYWHRHLLYILQERKAAALDDLNYIMKKNKNHAGAYRSMAEIYKKQGDTTMAVINYSSAIKSNPVDHEAFYQRAQLYEERGEMLLAMEDYTNAMKILPTRTDAIMKHAMYYFENENWQNAINDFTELLKVDSINATARLFRGRAYAKLNNWVPAVEDLSAAIHLDPYNWQAFYQRACILRRAHPKRALQDYSVSLMLNDSEENVMSYLHRGILYDGLGKPEDAIPDFESVLKLNKEIAAAHVNLGLIYMTKHLNYHRAIKKFSSAIKVDPTYVRAYVCRAEAYHKIHEVKNALKDFTRAIHLRPDMHHLYMYRGQLVLELGNLDLAGFCVRHASELGTKNSSATAFGGSPTQQAVVQSFLKNYDKAIDALVQASRVKPIAPYFMLLGKTYMKAKQFKEAVSSFKQALEKMRPWKKRDPWPPETADAHYLSGLCHMELRNYSDALQQFNFAIRFNSSYADAFYQRGLAAVKMKQMKGIQDFNRALALNPNIFQAYLSRACYYGLKGKYAKAILNCNEAIRLQPKSVRAYLYRGSLKYHIKAYELAILDLSKAAIIDTQCPLPYFNRAVCYHENHQYDKALTDYGIVLLLGSMLSLKVLINRGLLYFEKKDYMNALFDFQSAAKLSPNDHRIHHTLGLCFHKLNRLKEAVQTFTQCLQLKPFFLDGIIARGNVFMDYGHARGLEFSRRDYQRALHLDPRCLPARINLAYTAQMSGKLMQAWKHFTAVIEVRPGYKPALEGRAVVNLQMSSVFGAFQDITEAIKYGATAELLTNRGVINQFMGDPVMAMQDYQRAIKLDAKHALAYFNAANVYFHTRHFTQALDYYGKAITHKPDDESAYLNRAITRVLLHDTKGALEDFKVAAKLSPYSAHIYFNRGNLYASMQLFDKAEKEYTKALSLKPDDALMLKRRSHVRGKLGNQLEAMEDYKRAVDIQTRPNKLVIA